jgi:heterotetrameric sarcosine oxidase gamma subunit
MSPLPIRRSALEAVHARLGARWRSESERWPVSYGDVEGESRAHRDGIALAEPGPYDKLIVRGVSTIVDRRWLGCSARRGELGPARSLDGVNVWALAADEAVIVRVAGAAPTPGAAAAVGPEGSLSEIAGKLRSAGLSVVDVSSAYTIFRLVGPRLPRLLQELCSVDLAPRSVPDLRVVQAPFGGTRVILARRDHGDLPGFTLLVVRDEAEYLWDVIVHLGAAHGLRPVGAMAIRPPFAGDATAPTTPTGQPTEVRAR